MQISHPRTLRRAPVLASLVASLQPAAFPSETDPPVETFRKIPAGSLRKTRYIPAEPVDNRPTPEREDHTHIRTEQVRTSLRGPALAVRRVVGAVGLMWKKGEIEDAEHAAAERWYRDYATGVLGGRDPKEGRCTGGADAHDVQIARLSATTRSIAARRVIGFCGEVRMKAVMVDELTFVAAASRLMPGKSGGERLIKAQVELILKQLVEHYGAVDRARVVAEKRRKQLTDCTGTP